MVMALLLLCQDHEAGRDHERTGRDHGPKDRDGDGAPGTGTHHGRGAGNQASNPLPSVGM